MTREQYKEYLAIMAAIRLSNRQIAALYDTYRSPDTAKEKQKHTRSYTDPVTAAVNQIWHVREQQNAMYKRLMELDAMIDEIPELETAAIIRFSVLGMKYPEIALRIGTTPEAIRKRLKRYFEKQESG